MEKIHENYHTCFLNRLVPTLHCSEKGSIKSREGS